MKTYIYPYQIFSQSAKLLARGLNIKRLSNKFERKLTKPCRIINWGNSYSKIHGLIDWINPPDKVSIASNKLLTFNQLAKDGVNIPAFTTEKEIVREWLAKEKVVLVREKLRSHSGEGIFLLEGDVGIPDAPLYVEYIPKKKEFRVHVVNGEVIDVQEKRRRSGEGIEIDSKIRSHERGWVYCRQEITEPEDLRQLALDSIKSLGLSFGAVDIIWNQKRNKSYVLEINTAPGLEGTSLSLYTNSFSSFLK